MLEKRSIERSLEALGLRYRVARNRGFRDGNRIHPERNGETRAGMSHDRHIGRGF